MLARAAFFAEDTWHNLGASVALLQHHTSATTPLLATGNTGATNNNNTTTNAATSTLEAAIRDKARALEGDPAVVPTVCYRQASQQGHDDESTQAACVAVNNSNTNARAPKLVPLVAAEVIPSGLCHDDSGLCGSYPDSAKPTPTTGSALFMHEASLCATANNNHHASTNSLVSPTKPVVLQHSASWLSNLDVMETGSSLGLGSEGSSFDDDIPVGFASSASLSACGSLRRSGHSQSMENIVDLVLYANQAVVSHIMPELSVEGTGGTYFVKDASGRKVGVFKPSDEEVSTACNPHGYAEALKACIPKGESWKREIAAYRLDHGHFAGVPETFQIALPGHVFGSHQADIDKVGSFQRYISFDAEAWDVMPARLPTDGIHRIAILDIRLCNADRHGGNILVVKNPADEKGSTLVPIDHGCCIPTDLTELEFEWICWSQSKLPLDDACKQYVASLDAEADARILVEELGIDQRCADNVRAATLLLQRGVELGLTVYDIGCLMRRQRIDSPSALEVLLAECLQPMDAGGNVDFNLLTPQLRDMVAAAARTKAETGSVC